MSQMTDKLCVFCKRMCFDDGFCGTETTGSDPAGIYCEKGHWRMYSFISEDDFRAHIKKAETCPDYEVVE